MELNAEQIIKAFEVCRDKDLCNECPYEENIDCLRLREKHAIALMRSQEQRIKELTEENESLKKTIDRISKNNDEIARVYPLAIKEAKADTVRKTQKRLKAKAYTNNYGQDVVLLSNIDQIAKEMLEDTNES